MPLSEAEVLVVRSWVGATPTTEQLDERFDRLGSLDAVVTETLRSLLAALALDQPGRITLPSGLSVDFAEGIKTLQQLLKDFKALGGLEGGGLATLVTRLSRTPER